MSSRPETNGTVETVAKWSDTPLAQEVEFLAVKAFSEGTRHANSKLLESGLKVRSYSVLAMAASGVNPSQRDLAEFLALDPSQIVALVDDLEKKGLVTRVVDPGDRRAKVISATRAGVALWHEASAATEDAEAESLAMLTEGERDTLRSLLRKIVFSSPD